MNIPDAAKALDLAESTLRPGKGNYVHRRRPASERFASKVLLRSPTECWEWTGAKRSRMGHGSFMLEPGVWTHAHRFAWEQEHGPVPAGLQVLHHCDNPPCVNPAHLYTGTNADNLRDKMARGRQSRTGRKLTPTDVERIRTDTGRSMASFAREFGVTITVISRVRRRISYRSEL